MRPFGPPNSPGRIEGMRPWLAEVTNALIANFAGKYRIDIVDDFAYPLPVTAICRLLGVPREDQPRPAAEAADTLGEGLGPDRVEFGERVGRQFERGAGDVRAQVLDRRRARDE